ncbi:aminotransferase class IV [Clostridium lundense]|uniref:aminotransferase class IV n=1 Tax=Clostridium lundense TaxID=319475 RepID=UPI0004838F16|nr:aminotransferase class IV [Clostridium lundense]
MGITNNYFLFNDDLISSNCFDEEELLRGTSLYEVIKIKEEVPLFLEKHLERFHNSAKLINVKPWISDSKIKESLNKLIKENKVKEGSIKFVFNFEKNNFIVFFEEKNFPAEQQYKEGIDVALYNRERINPNAKVLNIEFRRDLDKFIKEKNIFEAILVDKNKDVTEGSKSNVFIVKSNKLITPPVQDVLPGTTRRTIFEICKELNIELIEEKINCSSIGNIDGMFISSTPFDILPVKKIDNIVLNSSENQLIKSIMTKFNEKVKKYIKFNLK